MTKHETGIPNSKTAEADVKPLRIVRCLLQETNDATGFFFSRVAVGALLMSNIFLSTSIITLAEMEVGCYSEDDEETEEIECDKVYGFKPSSLITNAAAVAGVLSAFFLPFIGALIDFTPYRRTVGIASAVSLILINSVQIGTVESTWFPMAILQAIAGFIYDIYLLVTFAYLPEISRNIEHKAFQWYTSKVYIGTYTQSVIFIGIVVAASRFFNLGDVKTAHVGQGIVVLINIIVQGLSWHYFEEREPARALQFGRSLFVAGFREVYQTAKGLRQHYNKSLGRFFLAIIFTQAAVQSTATVSVTFLYEAMNFNSVQIGIFFFLTLLAAPPGSYFANALMNKTNPIIALKLQLLVFIAVNFVAFPILMNPDRVIIAYVFGGLWGFLIGWIGPCEKLIFARITPPSQEAELTGFYLYCQQILTFLPPIFFTVFNESSLPLSFGGYSINIFLGIGLVILHTMASWSECLEDAASNKMIRIKDELPVDTFTDNEA